MNISIIKLLEFIDKIKIENKIFKDFNINIKQNIKFIKIINLKNFINIEILNISINIKKGTF